MALLHIENRVKKNFVSENYDNILVNAIVGVFDKLSSYERQILLYNGAKFAFLLSSISVVYKRDVNFQKC